MLKEYSAAFGLDVSQWKSNRSQYFKDAYPVFAFLAVWMDAQGLVDLVVRFGDILRAGVFAMAGYGILDENVDSNRPSPVEILVAQSLIAEYESLAPDIFGVSSVNLGIIHRMRSLFLEAKIREKSMRWKASPYRLDDPKQLGAKGANSVTPFMLSLERLGKASLIDAYWQVFLLFGAAIQMIDSASVDWNLVAEAYLAAYRARKPLDSTNLDYYRVSRCVMALIQGYGGQEVWRHPLIVDDLVGYIRTVTGVAIEVPG